MKFDTIYINGNIITVDSELPKASWVATSKGKIAGIGTEEPPIYMAAKTVDLKGKTMLPGLIDSHAHGTVTGLTMNSINLLEVTCISDVVKAVQEECSKSNGQGWIFGTGLRDYILQEGKPPSRWDLDAVSCEHPVLLVGITFHSITINTKAMELLKIPSDMPGVIKNSDGINVGQYISDESSFMGLSKALGFMEDHVIEKYIRDCACFAAEKGVTTLHSLDGKLVEHDRDFFIGENIKETLPIHIVHYFQTTNVNLVKTLKLPRIGGCLTLDGTGFEHTMAVTEPFADAPDCNGVLYWADQEVYDFVSSAHRAGLQCAMHAIGDRAIEQLITTYARVIKEQGNPMGIRHRIEHFSLCTPKQIELAAKLGLALPMQPMFSYLWDNHTIPGGNSYEMTIGKERTAKNDPFPDIIAAGGIISGGSDSGVTPIDPLMGIHAAVNAFNPKRRVSLDDAIKMFTINGAWTAHQEQEKGSIEIGKLADFTVIDKDPYDEPENIKDFYVEMTIVAGKPVYVR